MYPSTPSLPFPMSVCLSAPFSLNMYRHQGAWRRIWLQFKNQVRSLFTFAFLTCFSHGTPSMWSIASQNVTKGSRGVSVKCRFWFWDKMLPVADTPRRRCRSLLCRQYQEQHRHRELSCPLKQCALFHSSGPLTGLLLEAFIALWEFCCHTVKEACARFYMLLGSSISYL